MYKKILGIVFVLICGFSITAKLDQAYAYDPCPTQATGVRSIVIPSYPITKSHEITIDLSDSGHYDHTLESYLLVEASGGGNRAKSVSFSKNKDSSKECNSGKDCVSVEDGFVTFTIDSPGALSYSGGSVGNTDYFVALVTNYKDGDDQCKVGTYEVEKVETPGSCDNLEIFQNRNGESCYENKASTACWKTGEEIIVIATGLENTRGEPWDGPIGLKVEQDGGSEFDGGNGDAVNGEATVKFTPNVSRPPKEIIITLEARKGSNRIFPGCTRALKIENSCSIDNCYGKDVVDVGDPSGTSGTSTFSLCDQIPEAEPGQKDLRKECLLCAGGTEENEGRAGVWTAVGCIDKEPQAIIQRFISVGLGIGGGVALLTFLAAGFIFSTSQGNPEKVKGAKEMMTSSIVGILFILFSVTILQFIGWSVLKIPGFGG